ncbi:MAG: M23 family metallopeptidase [Pedobacter sp.]|nr:MAG: M23 family metallopeptidase [Pedobacter sp.]
MMGYLSTLSAVIVILGLAPRSFGQRYFTSPLNSLYMNQAFGWRIHPLNGALNFHDGVDLKADFEPVFSIADGEVVRVNINAVSGKFIVIRHGKLMSHYAHLSWIIVSSKDTVLRGQLIGLSGASGRTTGPHLHFALSYCGVKLDALKFLKALDAVNPGRLTDANSDK